jgi:Fic family protein
LLRKSEPFLRADSTRKKDHYVRQAPEARKPVGYDRKFLDNYRPNVSFYLTEQDRRTSGCRRAATDCRTARRHLRQGRSSSRLLIDLAWNSSRLEGNTYSLLDTKRLIELGEEARGARTSKRR